MLQLICKWLSRGFAEDGNPGCPSTDVAGRCCNRWVKKKKKVNLVTSERLRSVPAMPVINYMHKLFVFSVHLETLELSMHAEVMHFLKMHPQSKVPVLMLHVW